MMQKLSPIEDRNEFILCARKRFPVTAQVTNLLYLGCERLMCIIAGSSTRHTASTCTLSDDVNSMPTSSSSTQPSSQIDMQTAPTFRIVVRNSFIHVEETSFPPWRRSFTWSDSFDGPSVETWNSDPLPIIVKCIEGKAAPQQIEPIAPLSPENTPLSPAFSFSLEEDKVEEFPHAKTTLMVRYIPEEYSRDMFLQLLDAIGFAGRYRFVYVPVDFTYKTAVGYALVDTSTPQDALDLQARLQGFTEWAVPSTCVCEVSWSHPRQGIAEHIERYRDSNVMHPSVPDEFKPVLFDAGERITFPPPTKVLKPPRVRHAKT